MGSGAVPSGAAQVQPPATWRGRALTRDWPRGILGWVLLVAWAGWLVALWVVQPRPVAPSQLADDLAAGRVTGYRVVSVQEDRSGLFSPYRIRVAATTLGGGTSEETGGASGGSVTVGYWVDSPVAAFRVLDPNGLSSDVPPAEVRRLEAAGIRASGDPAFLMSPPGERVQNVGALLLALTLLAVLLGPRPSRGTRWFWFWLLPGPFALVVPAYAVLELLRPRADAEAQHPPGPAGRWRGLTGFALGLVTWVAVTWAVMTLSGAWPLVVPRG